MSPQHPLILGHRGLSARHPENSMESFKAALAAGMNGFELDVQPTRDGASTVLHDDTLDRTAQGTGLLRQMKWSDLPKLKNGEAIPRLADVLDLEPELINVELKGEPGWQQALATVEAAEALERVIFSSFEHSEVLQLWSSCPKARCGFLWNTEEAEELDADALEDLPKELYLHPSLAAVKARPELWSPYASRLVLWGMKTPGEARDLPFEPYALIANDLASV